MSALALRTGRWLSNATRLLLLAATATAALPTPSAAEWTEVLRERIDQFVRERVADPDAQITIPPLGDFELSDADPATLRIQLSTLRAANLQGVVPVTVAIHDGRRERKRGVISVHITRPRQVWVAARNLQRSQPLRAEDLVREPRDAAGLAGSATDDLAVLLGMQLRRNIAAGTPIQTDWVEAPTLVVRGQRVRLVLQAADLRIEGHGKALANGAAGENIRVLNTDSRREVIGRIGPDGAVYVAF